MQKVSTGDNSKEKGMKWLNQCQVFVIKEKTITVPPLNLQSTLKMVSSSADIFCLSISDSLLKSLTTLVNDTDKAIVGDSRNRYIHIQCILYIRICRIYNSIMYVVFKTLDAICNRFWAKKVINKSVSGAELHAASRATI